MWEIERDIYWMTLSLNHEAQKQNTIASIKSDLQVVNENYSKQAISRAIKKLVDNKLLKRVKGKNIRHDTFHYDELTSYQMFVYDILPSHLPMSLLDQLDLDNVKAKDRTELIVDMIMNMKLASSITLFNKMTNEVPFTQFNILTNFMRVIVNKNNKIINSKIMKKFVKDLEDYQWKIDTLDNLGHS